LGTSIGAAILSTAINVNDYSPVTNGLSSIGIGLGVQSAINTCFNEDVMSRVQQIALTVCGQTSIFFLTYLWENTTSLKAASLTGVGTMLGVNMAMYGEHYLNKWFHRIDSEPPRSSNIAKFSADCPTFMPKSISAFYPFASACSLVGWALSSNPVVRGITSFASLFFVSQFVSHALCNKIDNKIHSSRKTIQGNDGLLVTQLPRSRWRLVKGVVNGMSPIVIPLMWVPWAGDAQTVARTAQMWVVGLVTGLLDGYLWKSQENRFKNKGIHELDELKTREPNHIAFRVWRVAWNVLVQGGMLAVAVNELTSESNQLEDKIAIGVMYGSFLLSTIKNLSIDAMWKFDERVKKGGELSSWEKFKDRLVIQQTLPRLFGVAPVYMFLLLTNSVEMHSGQTLNTFHKTLNCVAWYFYGKAMQYEFHQTSSEKKGAAFLPMMAFLTGSMTVIKQMQGKIS